MNLRGQEPLAKEAGADLEGRHISVLDDGGRIFLDGCKQDARLHQ
jgi:hypothetical protein